MSMPANDPVDEVVLHTLLADGVDVPTAYAASIDIQPASRSAATNRRYFDAGLIAGLVLYVLYVLA